MILVYTGNGKGKTSACLGQVVRALGGIPVPTDIRNLGRFHGELLKLSPGNCVVIYPEAHIWPYYTGIRPFPATSFGYPAYDGAPVFAMTNCYQKRRFGRFPKVVTYLDGPFYPDASLPMEARKKKLRDQCYEAMQAEKRERRRIRR